MNTMNCILHASAMALVETETGSIFVEISCVDGIQERERGGVGQGRGGSIRAEDRCNVIKAIIPWLLP